MVQRLMEVVGDEIAGLPIRDERWVRRSLAKLQAALAKRGEELGQNTIRRLLLAKDIRARANVKHLTPKPHPDRDLQFPKGLRVSKEEWATIRLHRHATCPNGNGNGSGNGNGNGESSSANWDLHPIDFDATRLMFFGHSQAHAAARAAGDEEPIARTNKVAWSPSRSKRRTRTSPCHRR